MSLPFCHPRSMVAPYMKPNPSSKDENLLPTAGFISTTTRCLICGDVPGCSTNNTSYQHILSIHPISTPFQHLLSTHSINTFYQYTLSTHPINILDQYSPPKNNTRYQFTISRCPIDIPNWRFWALRSRRIATSTTTTIIIIFRFARLLQYCNTNYNNNALSIYQ